MAFEHPFYFLRHGETTWNAIGKTQGQLDAPLSERGLEQASHAARLLKDEPIRRIVSSPLSRARDTAEAASKTTGAPVTVDDDLMEFHAGTLQGEPRGEYVKEYFEGTWDPPEGEKLPVFARRAWAALARAVEGGPGTLVVCHGGLWYAAQMHVEIAPTLRPMPNALPIHVTPGRERWAARVLG